MPVVVPPAAGGRADHENSRYRCVPPTRVGPVTPAGRGWPAPPRPPRATPHDRAGHSERQSGKRAHNCIRRRIPAGAMACYLPRYRPFACGTLKCTAAAI